MSNSIRSRLPRPLAPLASSLSLALALPACIDRQAGEPEPISSQESAATTQATEDVVITMAPISSASLPAIAAAYRQAFTLGAQSCATVATDNLTSATITFSCSGPLATTGTLALQVTSPSTLDATLALEVGGVPIDGVLHVSAPTTPGAPRALDGELVIEGPRRALSADLSASWQVSGACVTYSASGNVAVDGLSRSGARSFQVDARTACQP